MAADKELHTAEGQRRNGMQMLVDVAMRYAHQHGLEPGHISWDQITDDQLLLVIETATQSVSISFSVDEIEDFPGGAGTSYTKKKIRDKFAGLSM